MSGVRRRPCPTLSHRLGGRGRATYTRAIAGPLHVTVLCTGNICRSPMGEALLADRLRARGVDAVVDSAGLMGAGHPAADHTLAVLQARGIDHSAHRSRVMDAGMLEPADLILAMTREHLREAAVLAPHRFGRIFTLKELVRRAASTGPRGEGETIDEWLERLGEGRDRRDLLGTSAEDDVADPYGMDRRSYERTYDEIESLVDRFVDLAWPEPVNADQEAS